MSMSGHRIIPSATIETEARPPEIDVEVLVVEQNTEDEVTSDSNDESEVNSPDFTIDEPFSVRLGAIELGLYDLLSFSDIHYFTEFIRCRSTNLEAIS